MLGPLTPGPARLTWTKQTFYLLNYFFPVHRCFLHACQRSCQLSKKLQNEVHCLFVRYNIYFNQGFLLFLYCLISVACFLGSFHLPRNLPWKVGGVVWCVYVSWYHVGVFHLSDFDRWDTPPLSVRSSLPARRSSCRREFTLRRPCSSCSGFTCMSQSPHDVCCFPVLWTWCDTSSYINTKTEKKNNIILKVIILKTI